LKFVLKLLQEMIMTLYQYFVGEPLGAKKELADYLGITPTWISLLISGRRKPSPALAKAIERATQGLVTAAELRPDLFA
jgi:DNA-binding transcriptional regulator YdaS (Cro superfamily)